MGEGLKNKILFGGGTKSQTRLVQLHISDGIGVDFDKSSQL